MTPPILDWYDGDDPIEAPNDLAAATPGTPSTASAFDFWNDKDAEGADTAYDLALELLVRVPLTGEEINAATPPRPFVSIGHEAVNNYWFQARITAGLGSLSLSAGPWTPLGAGRVLRIPTLESEQGVTIELRLNVPSDAQNRYVEWTTSVIERVTQTLPLGLHESIGPGVNLGIGDSELSQLLYVSANVTENGGGADDKVQMPDISWVYEGTPYNVVRHLKTISNTDGAAAALGAGESYYDLLYAKSDGTIGESKGLKTSTPGPDDFPTLPAGVPLSMAIAMVLREADADGGDIETADITNQYVVGAAHFSSSALTGSIGPYRIVNDNRLDETSTATTVSLTDAATNRVWHIPGNGLQVTTTAARPSSRAMLLWEAVAAGGVVTSSTDRRLFFAFGYRLQRLDFLFDATLVVGQKQRLCYHGTRTGYILPIGGISMHLLDNGDTSDATKVDINLRAPGGAFTTIFTSQGSEDRRPSIAHDSTSLVDSDAFPEVLAVPAHSLLEVEVDQIPGGSVPAWLNVSILVACP